MPPQPMLHRRHCFCLVCPFFCRYPAIYISFALQECWTYDEICGSSSLPQTD